GAPQRTLAPADKPFLLGLPIPDGAKPADLAVAVLTPAEGGFGDAAGSAWHVVPGSYDVDSSLFVITNRNLLPAPMTVVLIEHPDLEPLPSAAQARATAS